MNKNDNFLLITTDFPPDFGGVANYWSNLSRELALLLGEDRYAVLAPHKEGDLRFDISQNYIIYRRELYYKKFWPKWLKIFFPLWKIIKQRRVNFLLVTQILPVGTVAFFCKILLGVNYAVSLHGLDLAFAQKKKIKRVLTRIILNYADYIFVNSKFTKTKLLEFFPKGKIKVEIIYPCCSLNNNNYPQQDLVDFKNGQKLQDKKMVLSVGRLVERKGFDTMIKALPQVLQKFPELVYVIYGVGQEKERLNKLAQELKVEKSILITNEDSLEKYYQSCDLFVLPCRELANGDVEGFGIVFLEAGIFGKAVIAGNSGGAPEAVVDGETGFVIDPTDEQWLAEKVLELLQNRELAERLGQNGQKRASDQFVWSKQAKKLLMFITKEN